MTFNQGGGNQFLRPKQELSIGLLSETAAAAFCSESFSLPRNCSERNSEDLLIFLLHGRECRVVFSSAEGDWNGREFQEFASIIVPRNGISSCFSSAEGFVRDFSSLGRYVFGSEISYNKAPPRLPGLAY